MCHVGTVIKCITFNSSTTNNMKATHKIVEGKTNRQLANEALKAMGLICEADCGTIRNHYEIASGLLK